MILNALFLALREIRNNLMRAGLTTLGIVIGVAAVIMMVTLGNSASKSVTGQIASMGRNLIVVFPGQRQGPPGAAPSFTLAMAQAISHQISGLDEVAPEAETTAEAVLGSNNHSTQVVGSTNAVFPARNLKLTQGRTFTLGELRSGKAVCVIGQTIRKDLFGAADPIGARFRLNKMSCEVVGLLEAKGTNTFGQDQDDIVVMPLLAVQRRLVGNNNINVILASAHNPADETRLKGEIERLMRQLRHLAAGVPDDFTVQDMQEITREVESTTAILTAFLSAVAAVSLLVGGIGIMNIMLVSVTERTREIGIRLAIGALEHDVLMQFLIEAVAMSALGGAVGVVLGLSGSAIVAHLLKFPLLIQPGVVVLAVLFSAAVGVGFGYFPARRAARLDPIEALRHE
ncbi:MAG: ABC transporter permease [Alphaproteobacteria bacterium]|nr:ABC transporter permease [Alphaproteobacteria bacterium]